MSRVITYKEYTDEIDVYLDDRKVGSIHGSDIMGWWYHPMYRPPGEIFKTLKEVKYHVEHFYPERKA